MNKATVIKTMEGLPENFDADSLIERLIFIQQVEEGREDLKMGRSISLEELEAEFEGRWKEER